MYVDRQLHAADLAAADYVAHRSEFRIVRLWAAAFVLRTLCAETQLFVSFYHVLKLQHEFLKMPKMSWCLDESTFDQRIAVEFFLWQWAHL